LLHRSGQERDTLCCEERSAVVDGRTRPQRPEQIEALVEDVAALARVGRLSEARQLTSRIDAEPDAEDEPPSREVVERHRLAGELLGTATHDRRDHRPDPHAARHHRDGRQRDPRIGDLGRLAGRAEHVIPQEEPVPAALLRCGRQVHQRPDVCEWADRWKKYGMTHCAQGSHR